MRSGGQGERATGTRNGGRPHRSECKILKKVSIVIIGNSYVDCTLSGERLFDVHSIYTTKYGLPAFSVRSCFWFCLCCCCCGRRSASSLPFALVLICVLLLLCCSPLLAVVVSSFCALICRYFTCINMRRPSIISVRHTIILYIISHYDFCLLPV